MEISLPEAQAEFIERQLREGRYLDAGEVVRDALRRFEQQQLLAGADIEAELTIVLLEAARSAEQDLRDIMAGVRAINAAKQALRELVDGINRDVVANTRVAGPLDFSTGLGSEERYHAVDWPVPDVEAPGGVHFAVADLWPRRITAADELRAILERVKSDLDGLSEMSQLDSLRLQQALDRRSRFLEALSNIEKKLSDTASAIVQNLK